jgi:hypothetical protein
MSQISPFQMSLFFAYGFEEFVADDGDCDERYRD